MKRAHRLRLWLVAVGDGWTRWRMVFHTRREAREFITASQKRWPQHDHRLTVWTRLGWGHTAPGLLHLAPGLARKGETSKHKAQAGGIRIWGVGS